MYGDTSRLSANQFFYGLRHGDKRIQIEKGVELLIGLEAISDADERGIRTVMCIVDDWLLRPVVVRDLVHRDRGACRGEGRPDQPQPRGRALRGRRHRERRRGRRGFGWAVHRLVEAMKMEAAITAPKAGKVERVAVAGTAQVEGGDLLVVIS